MAIPLAFMGLPLYIHLPKFYHDHYNVSLIGIGLILFFSRLMDAIIDPLLGLISDKYNITQKKFFLIFGCALIISFNGFFWMLLDSSPNNALVWFVVCTILSYFFFSLLYINYYNLSLKLAKSKRLLIKLSGMRETLAFLGILLAAITPSLLSEFIIDENYAFKIYGLIFAGIMILALCCLPKIPTSFKPLDHVSINVNAYNRIKELYKDFDTRNIIILFFVNSLPISITSNLFMFYVDLVLNLKSSASAFLCSYFLAAAVGAIIASTCFKSIAKTKMLLIMMLLSILSFTLTCFLDQSNGNLFYIICFLSGIGLGGELVILPILASNILLSKKIGQGNTFFGIWISCNKISLAMAAGIFLPLITLSNEFMIGITLQDKLIFYYAIIPISFKFIAVIFLIHLTPKLLRTTI